VCSSPFRSLWSIPTFVRLRFIYVLPTSAVRYPHGTYIPFARSVVLPFPPLGGTTASADFLQFVVTTANGTACKTSRDKLLVFPRLPAWFTHMGYGRLLDFATSCQLIRHIRLDIRFLFVRLRFRYLFFLPIPHDTNLESRSGVRRQLRPLWTFTTDWQHARHTQKRLCNGI